MPIRTYPRVENGQENLCSSTLFTLESEIKHIHFVFTFQERSVPEYVNMENPAQVVLVNPGGESVLSVGLKGEGLFSLFQHFLQLASCLGEHSAGPTHTC